MIGGGDCDPPARADGRDPWSRRSAKNTRAAASAGICCVCESRMISGTALSNGSIATSSARSSGMPAARSSARRGSTMPLLHGRDQAWKTGPSARQNRCARNQSVAASGASGNWTMNQRPRRRSNSCNPGDDFILHLRRYFQVQLHRPAVSARKGQMPRPRARKPVQRSTAAHSTIRACDGRRADRRD